MTIDVYVMPLWRYLSGAYLAPVEQLVGAGAEEHERPDRPIASQRQARQFVRHLRHTFAHVSDHAARWKDEGRIVLAQQLRLEAWHALRAFAANLRYPVEPFHFGPASHQHPALREIFAGAPSAYVHLIRHHDDRGFYLPIEFGRPIELALREDASSTIIAGSSATLLRELNQLGPRIGMTRDLGEMEEGETFALRPEPLKWVKYGWAFMRHAARLSLQHRLPIIFDG